MDIGMLVDAMVTGAAVYGPQAAQELAKIAVTEIVKDETKGAYAALKDKLSSILGRRATRAAEKVEQDPASADARNVLALALSELTPDDYPEVEEKRDALLAALKDDNVAIKVAEVVAGIKLNIESGGSVRLINIKGARTIDVTSKSKDDFEMRDITMDGGRSQGN